MLYGENLCKSCYIRQESTIFETFAVAKMAKYFTKNADEYLLYE